MVPSALLVMDIDIIHPSGEQTAILLAGWPDTSDVFRGNIADVLIGNNFRVVGLTLPLYRPEEETAAVKSKRSVARKWIGYSLEELVVLLKEALDASLEGHILSSSRRPIMICHDWGCLLTFELLTKYPFYFEKIVCLDVGGHAGGDLAQRNGSTWNLFALLLGSHCGVTFGKGLFMMMYQFVIMACYLMFPRMLGDLCVSLLSAAGGRPTYADRNGITVKPRASMGYPYFYLWLGLVTRMPLQTVKFFTPVNVPCLYLYGDKKPFQFHSKDWVEHLKQRRRQDNLSDSVCVEGGDHWFFTKLGASEAMALRRIEEFVQAPIL